MLVSRKFLHYHALPTATYRTKKKGGPAQSQKANQYSFHDRYVSPRKRAQRTFELINLGILGDLPWQAHGASESNSLQCRASVEVTEDVREWDYGDYEGITSPEIRKIRADAGIQGTWDIWRDGCPGGE